MARFTGLNTQVLGISIDHVPCLTAWAESLGGIHYPLLSDFWPHGTVADLYGVLRKQEGHSERALFVIDQYGFIRYIDIHDISTQPDNEILRNVIREIDPRAAAHEKKPQAVDLSALPQSGVVMYCTKWCPDCKRARIWLASNGIEYSDLDIYNTPGAEAQVRKWCGGSIVTPTFSINGTIVVDFDPEKIKLALGL
jgi:glutaredoxin